MVDRRSVTEAVALDLLARDGIGWLAMGLGPSGNSTLLLPMPIGVGIRMLLSRCWRSPKRLRKRGYEPKGPEATSAAKPPVNQPVLTKTGSKAGMLAFLLVNRSFRRGHVGNPAASRGGVVFLSLPYLDKSTSQLRRQVTIEPPMLRSTAAMSSFSRRSLRTIPEVLSLAQPTLFQYRKPQKL
jgi:hypothetical protein